MGAIRDNEVKQLFLNANKGLSLEVVYKTIFFSLNLIYIIFIAPPFCNLYFYFKRAEVSGVARGISKIELKQKAFNLFSLSHPQG